MKNSSTIFTCGPFVSASLGADSLSRGLYCAMLLSQSVESQRANEERLQKAIEESADQTYIDSIQREADYQNSLLDLAITSLSFGEEIEQ